MHTTGVTLLHHPFVGHPDLPFETLPLPDGPSQFLLTYTAEPHSPSPDALNLLAGWTDCKPPQELRLCAVGQFASAALAATRPGCTVPPQDRGSRCPP
ncbi:hypothetical protein ACIBAH_33205 [Streptomyces sp. NPDC051445]|uniref:MmyB family transcriptional regulator n=1 Tax=Streptomyces sp. NPDC051445 TaxID=3365653 RepID=UPI0037A8B9BD